MSALWTAKGITAVKGALASTALKIARDLIVVLVANTMGVLKIAKERRVALGALAISALKIVLVTLVENFVLETTVPPVAKMMLSMP